MEPDKEEAAPLPSSKEKYIGEVNDAGERSGPGEVQFPDQKCSVKGQFVKGALFGKGLLEWEDAVYEGEFKANQRDGMGTLRWKNGLVYEGEFKNNTLEGQGKLSWPSPGDIYEGSFHHNQIEGRGTYTFHSGDTYKGDFKAGVRDGRGVYKHANGDVYNGDFKDGVRCGMGTLVYSNGNCYQGQFEANQRHGIGKFVWSGSNNWYEGRFLHDQLTGHGLFRYITGEWYEGEYVKGQRDGPGVFCTKNFDLFEEVWKSGKLQSRKLIETGGYLVLLFTTPCVRETDNQNREKGSSLLQYNRSV
jgi:hypothetical protein